MAEFPDKFFDLAVVDPPYGIGAGQMNMGRSKKRVNLTVYKMKSWDANTPNAAYFAELFRVSQNQIVWGGNYMTQHLPPSPCWLLWDKKFPEAVAFAQYEMAWSSFKSSAKKFEQFPDQSHTGNRIHPTQKPIALYDWIFATYAKPGQKVLDTHLGSGSSRIAANKAGIDFWGYELDADYFAAHEKRYANFISQLRMF
jgi:site-specific DNA-methyltransferase (adenine-specific)